jgi:hypothetical protein
VAVHERLKLRLSERTAADVLSSLRVSAETLPPKLLVRLIKDVTDEIIDGRSSSSDVNVGHWLDVLPKLLELVATADIIA